MRMRTSVSPAVALRLAAVALAMLLGASEASAAPAPAEKKPIGLKVTAGVGPTFLIDPVHGAQAIRVQSMVGLSWAPGRIPGEVGFSLVLANADILAMRGDLKFFSYKGETFSQYLGLNFNLIPSAQYAFGGGGLTFGFEWKVIEHLAVVWTLGADLMTYPIEVAPTLTFPESDGAPPKAVPLGIASSLVGIQARF